MLHMETVRESALYEIGYEEGEKQGRQQGIEQGLEQGVEQGIALMLRRNHPEWSDKQVEAEVGKILATVTGDKQD